MIAEFEGEEGKRGNVEILRVLRWDEMVVLSCVVVREEEEVRLLAFMRSSSHVFLFGCDCDGLISHYLTAINYTLKKLIK